MCSDEKHININTEDDLIYLVDRIKNGPTFARTFIFDPYELKTKFLSSIGIFPDEFNQKYYYFNEDENLHISESEGGYIWISNMGLVAQDTHIDSKYIRAHQYQYTVLSLLMDKAISLCKEETIYCIDSYTNGYLSEFTPALFHNMVFYIETFGKAYLSLCNIPITKTHKLSDLLAQVKDTMFNRNHNDTIFHARIFSSFEDIVNYISTIPGNFKEHYIKYADNPDDFTVIRFRDDIMIDIKAIIDLSHDFIMEYYYGDPMYLKQGLFNRLLKKATTAEDKQKITSKYGYLNQPKSL